jgi:hypothetical protein
VIDLKKGAIICIDGKPPDDWAEGAEIFLRKQLSRFDAVRFITPQINSFLLHGIWLKMLSRGITDLFVTMATFSDTGNLKLGGKGFRLPIIGMN